MKKRFFGVAVIVILTAAYESDAAAATRWKTIYTFAGRNDGQYPIAPLIADAKGNLYGTTSEGGGGLSCAGFTEGCGTVFELVAPASPSGRWQEQILHTFTGGSDGSNPVGGLIFDAAGNLYGTTFNGGDLSNSLCADGVGNIGCGVAFELSPPSSHGGAWTETVLHMFEEGGMDGAFPAAGLVFDAVGNLYGTAAGGVFTSKSSNLGGVFQLSPAGGGPWNESMIYSFLGLSDGYAPYGPLVFDGSGNLYGTTSAGGNDNDGAVFQLVPPVGPGPWTENSLLDFNGSDGAYPTGGLLVDPSGNLFGTTAYGGSDGDGVAFELVPPQSGGSWTEVVLWNFIGSGGDANPYGFVQDALGNLYGTTLGNSDNACGEVFELSNAGGTWSESKLHLFTEKHFNQGGFPQAPVVYGKWNALYGTTTEGGKESCGFFNDGCGTVFGLLP